APPPRNRNSPRGRKPLRKRAAPAHRAWSARGSSSRARHARPGAPMQLAPMRNARARAFSLAVVLSLATAFASLPCACSGSAGYSGRYQAGVGDGRFTLDFKGGNKVKVSIGTASKVDELSHDCVYEVHEDRITFTTDEPMGVPMTLKIEGDT